MSSKEAIKRINGKPRITNKGQPEFWPFLQEGDIDKGPLTYDDGTPRCMLGWLEWIMTTPEEEEPCKMFMEAYRTIRKNIRTLNVANTIAITSDRLSELERVEVWNKTGEDLGYTRSTEKEV